MAARIPILYQDDWLIVAAKPAGMLSVPTPNARGTTLVEALREQGCPALPVHRLDRETSGALLFARDEATRAALEEQFRSHALRKIYWAMAAGRLPGSSGEFRFPILEHGGAARIAARGLEALTRWRVLAAYPATTEVEVELVTGRYNQIRLHFAHAGHPLLGERKYARGKDAPLRLRSRRVALHAWKLFLTHPRSGNSLVVEAPLPDDLIELRRKAVEARDKLHRYFSR